MATSQYCRFPSSIVVSSSASTGPNGSPAPTSSTEIGFIDGSGNLQGVSPSNPLPVTSSAGANANGSAASASVSTVITIAKPANAVGFVLQCDEASTDFIRWCDSNSIASSTNGSVLQPGQDTGYVPMAKSLSVCAHSGTQAYNIQWVLSS